MKKWTILLVTLLFVGMIFLSCSDDDGTTDPSDTSTLTCNIATPIALTGFYAGDSIDVTAVADDNNGTIIEVRFILDDNGFSSDQEFPYTAKIPTDTLAVGTHTINAIAENDDGKEVTASVSVGIIPKSPTNLNITQLNVYTFYLSWNDNSTGEDGFKIERKIDDGEFTEIITTTEGTFIDSTISKKGLGTVYYQVKAFKDIYNSEYASNNATVGFPAPSNLNIAPTSVTSATLTWNDNSDGEDIFEIERKLSTETIYINIAEVLGSETTTKSWNDSSLTPTVIYDYRIRAIKGDNSTSYTSISGYIPFRAPENLNITQTSITSAYLVWDDHSVGEDRFEIERKLSMESTYVKIAEVTGSNTSTKSWNDTSLEPTEIYDYRVKGVKGTDSSTYVTKLNYNNEFQAPGNFTYSKITLSTIKLDWLDESNGEDGFKIDKKVGLSDWVIDYGIVSENTSTWTDSNAEINDSLQYRIYAYNGLYNSGSVVTSTIDNTFPAPTGFTIEQISLTEAILNWNDNSIGEEKFIIERKLSSESAYVKIGEVTGSDTSTKSWNETSILLDNIYDYRINAFYGSDSSDFAIQSIEHNFLSPTNLYYVATNSTIIEINWDDNTNIEDGFIIDKKVGELGTWVTEYASVGSGITIWTDTEFNAYEKYYYRIRAFFQTYESNNSSELMTKVILEDMIFISSGSFSMGLDGIAYPVHDVTLTNNFYIGKYEITNQEYCDMLNYAEGQGLLTASTSTVSNNSGNSQELLDLDGTDCQISYNGSSFVVDVSLENRPVTEVTWYGSAFYCNILSLVHGLTELYNLTDWSCTHYGNRGFRLPTEAEWESSARSNTNIFYPWGNDSPTSTHCNYDRNVGHTTDVGSYSPKGDTNTGICDMAGNVVEWCGDWYNEYTSANAVNPTGFSSGTQRILRGGWWSYNYCYSMKRYYWNPDTSENSYGFRVVQLP